MSLREQSCGSITSVKGSPGFTTVRVQVAAEGGEFLATRTRAAQIRVGIEQRLRSVDGPVLLELSFQGVTAVTLSFADELLGRLVTSIAARDLGSVAVLLTNVDPEVLEDLSISLQRRKVAVPHRVAAGRVELVGDNEPTVAATFAQAVTQRIFRANDIAASLDISAQNANNRLKRLVESAAVIRRPERTGREFEYFTPVADTG